MSAGGSADGNGGVAVLDIPIQDRDEFRNDVGSLERYHQTAVYVDGGLGLFECSGERDADIGVLGFAGAVDDAAHHRYLQLLDAGVALAPDGHLVAEVGLDLVGHFLEEGTGGAPAAGASSALRREAENFEGLQDLLADAHFLRAIAVGHGGERGPDGIADAFLEKNAKSSGARDDALCAH